MDEVDKRVDVDVIQIGQRRRATFPTSVSTLDCGATGVDDIHFHRGGGPG